MKNYKGWNEVPPNYKLKSDLGRFGLKLSPGQKPVATISGGPTGIFGLYDTTQCVPIKRRKAK